MCRHTAVRVCTYQIEFRDMRVRLLLTLMSTDDAVSAEQADQAVNECLSSMLSHNYDLYVGRNGILAARDDETVTVCAWPARPTCCG